MADINNSDIKVLGNKIDNLASIVGKVENKQDAYHAESQQRLQAAETQLKLMEQSFLTICDDIEDNETNIEKLRVRQNKHELATKVVGGIEGLIVAGLTYLGLSNK